MRTLMLEFNELVPDLLDRFIAAGQLPGFARLREKSIRCITDAQESPPNLEPWIQWVTVHTGLSFDEHRCFNLNDGVSLKAPRIWDVASKAGKSNWICGSMNTSFDAESFRGYFLPDPWASDAAQHPAGYFEPFSDVVRAFVQEHSGKPDVGAAKFARFARFMVGHGLSLQTVSSALTQLASERLTHTKWRRALILDRLQWDLFRAIHSRETPDFATFFLNSTAHFQHFHWREMEPDLFDIKPSDSARGQYSSAILAGYQSMDRIVAQAIDLMGPDGCVVLCTALSQQPMVAFEQDGGRQIFRHRDIGKLTRFAGITETYDYRPLMSQEFQLECHGEAEAREVASRLSALSLPDGSEVMWAVAVGSRVEAGCKVYRDPGGQNVTSGSEGDELPFAELFYPLESLRSGMHSPDGIFWVHAPGRVAETIEDKIPLTDVFPTLLDVIDAGQSSARTSSLLRKIPSARAALVA
ncbi:alkaline phosphatase family protein [Aurantiacibacter poecillastricola]|uniref:alkaline phosphatase family protein n=1 Tax=Aurantiacibacter poecillastricola TaxID=3064385 RepID=UPI00273E6151|nr:alkaline phosphatase family protein [Aurantiacibacter sp. 219JJ12-13]MDP5263209.1 alkaline phosphatase family protein [Aurantiacibacter sp. 219JJ12-13]